MKPQIIGVRFQEVGKIYHFDASTVDEIRIGDRVIVDTARGQQLGEVTNLVDDPESSHDKSLKPVERKATPRDLILKKDWQNKEIEALINCRERSSQLHLQRVKFIAAEFNFDGSRLNIMYNSDNEEKVDLKSLRSDIGKIYPKAKVDLRQIGPRDVAKIIGGMGACGLEKRCCSNFITEFSPISIKMAKEQGISLTPAEITGMCGRLRCCLVYEYQNYVDARKELPKRGKKVKTPRGDGKVTHVNPLSFSVTVDIPNEGRSEFFREELEPWDELEALRRKSAESCNSDGSGCNCGKTKE
ncbi:MAG TPA: regulatory iron-sulfur-containing complex subunit RicT [Anaerolineales bacterium]|nr:regulatory iron-sulfur-containing complex subunit RicT [Anaerolineales bacterium]